MKNNNLKLADYIGELNFAFCPTSALIVSDAFISKNNDILSLLKEYDSEKIKNLKNAFRYFYICYSINVSNLNQENRDYFYFQLFVQIGDQQSELPPVFGFYTYDDIISLIRDIDVMFVPTTHEKQIFESYSEDITASADVIINLMQDWTTLKLMEFKNLYFRDEDAVDNLYKMLENLEAEEKLNKKPRKKRNTSKSKPKTIIKKTRTTKNKNEKNK